MEKSLSDYDQSLEELERQREQLELVMKKMGQEWEESGAGIAWLGSVDLADQSLQSTDLSKEQQQEKQPPQQQQQQFEHLRDSLPTPLVDTPEMMAPLVEPHPDDLPTLLTNHDSLLAQSMGGPRQPPKSIDLNLTSNPISPPTTPDEYPMVRASCLSRSNSLAKSAVMLSSNTPPPSAGTDGPDGLA